MRFDRRAFLQLAAGAAVVPALSLNARAQAYPARPLRLVIGFPAGGPNDILGRLMAGWLSERLGQPVVVENRPGQSGNIASEEVVRAAPDGYTLLLMGPANAISGSLYPNLNFSAVRDLAPVAAITREALVMVVHPSVTAKTVVEFIADAKANPGKLKMASTGNGSSPHVTGELFKMMTGLDLPVVHYAGGGPALKAMIAGETQMMFEPMSASIEPVRTGKLRALGVTTAARSAALPDVPAVGEFVPGYEASALTGIGAPRDTPAAVIERLNREINAAFVRPRDEGAARRHRRHRAARLGGRVRQANCRGNREVGQGGEGFGHQAELIHVAPRGWRIIKSIKQSAAERDTNLATGRRNHASITPRFSDHRRVVCADRRRGPGARRHGAERQVRPGDQGWRGARSEPVIARQTRHRHSPWRDRGA